MDNNLVFSAAEGLPIQAPDSFQVHTQPPADPGSGELLVKVAAISINPIDTKLRQNLAKNSAPKIFGYDACGVVVQSRSAKFQAGQKVIYAGSVKRPGSYQQYQVVRAELAALAPAGIPDFEAAALPLVGLTAWELLFEKMGFAAEKAANTGRKLLVINGAGGVGSLLTQLAAWSGLEVWATASPKHFDWLRGHHVKHCLDYHQPLAASCGQTRFDGIAILYDPAVYLDTAIALLKPFGHIGTIVTPTKALNLAALKDKAGSLDFEFMFTKTNFDADAQSQGQILQKLAALLAGGVLSASVTKHYTPISLANLKTATQQVEGGHQVGKVTLSGPFSA